MKKQNFFDYEINQYELSYEFLHLLKWLAEHEAESLKKIIARAVKDGFNNPQNTAHATPESIQSNIINFLDLLDLLLVEVIQEQTAKKIVDRNLIPALDQIDTRVCDKTIVQSSLEKVTSALEQAPDENPKEALFKELLKRWKPQKNQLN